jgi:periplasmic divalent cation tolerance protein
MNIIYITTSSVEEAKTIAKHLLEKRMIACANIYSNVASMYCDNGIKEATEAVLMVKTIEAKYNAVKKEIENMHSYTIPCILKISAKANKKYEEWVKEQIK